MNERIGGSDPCSLGGQPRAREEGTARRRAAPVPSGGSTQPRLEALSKSDRPRGKRIGDGSAASESPSYSFASVGGEPFAIDEQTPLAIRDYLATTLSHTAYTSEAELKRRAENYLRNKPAELGVLRASLNALENPDSPLVAQSSWLVNLERGMWFKGETFGKHDRTRLAREVAGEAAPVEGSPFHGSPSRRAAFVKRAVGVPEQARRALAMILRGAEGPMTFDDAQQGVAINNAAKLMAAKLESPAVRERTELWRSNVIKANRNNTQIASTPHGVDLSADVCTQALTRLDMAVAAGVSSTAAETMLLTRFLAEQQGLPWVAPGLTETEAATAVIDLMMIYLRQGAVPKAVANAFNELRREMGLPAKSVAPEDVLTHSYGEIHVGVQLAMRGAASNDADAVDAAALSASRRLDTFR